MNTLDYLAIGTMAFTCYCVSGYAGRNLYAFSRWRSRKVIRGDQTGDVVGRNRMGTFNISGQTFRGNNISITNDRIVIDGKDVTDQYDIRPVGILEITVLEGTIGTLTADGSVSCNDVTGDVSAGGSVKSGDVQGSVNAGGSVKCGSVGGSINAGGSVKHG